MYSLQELRPTKIGRDLIFSPVVGGHTARLKFFFPSHPNSGHRRQAAKRQPANLIAATQHTTILESLSLSLRARLRGSSFWQLHPVGRAKRAIILIWRSRSRQAQSPVVPRPSRADSWQTSPGHSITTSSQSTTGLYIVPRSQLAGRVPSYFKGGHSPWRVVLTFVRPPHRVIIITPCLPLPAVQFRPPVAYW